MPEYLISKRDLSTFQLIDLQRFLELKKWKISEEKKNVIVYEKSIEETEFPLRFYLPSNDANVDYFERIGEIVKTLSTILNIPLNQIISLIGRTSNDILRLRIPNPGKYSYSIPLDIASKEVDALKRLFMFGASSEQQARPFFDQATTIGKNHANQCQFGHTFEGSFGFTINSPIIDDYSQLTLFEENKIIPFERKVMERIITGFSHIKEAASNSDPSIIVENFESGLNSKMCDAIVDLSIEKTKTIEFQIDWSPQLETSVVLARIQKIILDPYAIELTEEASRQLKLVEPFNDIIIGKIVTLHSNKIPFEDEEFPRIAIIKHSFDNKNIEVKLELTRDEYRIVYDAHGEGQTVKVVGKLYRKGSSWRMVEIESIEVFHS